MSNTVTPTAADFESLVDRDRLIERLETLVRSPSENPPGREAEVAGIVAGYCEDIGLEVERHEVEPGRPSIIARNRSDGAGAGSAGTRPEAGPTLVYCSHIDVVPAGDPELWELDPYGADVIEGRMHGRGSSDAKGPVAAALEAAAILEASGVSLEGTLELALVADEEAMGFKGAGHLVAQGILKPDVAIIGEPTSLRVVRAQRGACWLRIATRGVAGHGSAPERGVNAIRHMSEIVLRLEETLPDISHDVLGGPSLNVGTIMGGAKVNIIPAACLIEVDRRTIPQETEASVLAGIRAAIDLAKGRFPDLDARVEAPFFGRAFEIPVDAPVVREVAASVGDAVGREAELIGFRGASDARFMAEAGADVVVCGPGDISLAHTARESIDLGELERCAVAYALSFARLLAPGGLEARGA